MTSSLARRAVLGVELPPEAFTPEGMRVAGVVAGSMAEVAGVLPGDLLARLGPWPLRSAIELRAALREAGALEVVELTVLRGGAKLSLAARVERRPAERIEGAEVLYDEINSGGARLRVIVTRPEGAQRSPAVLVIQGISFDSVDLGGRPDSPLFRLIQALSGAGLVTMRLERRGVGDSEGESCESTGFNEQVEDVKVAVRALAAYPFVDARAIFAFGHSVGGMIAPLLEPLGVLRGYIVFGTSSARWLDCVEASTRRQLLPRGIPPADCERMGRLDREELERGIQGLGPMPWSGGAPGAAFHRELQATDLARAWAEVKRPVLLVHGEYDCVVGEEEHAEIARILSEGRPGGAEVQMQNIPGLDHSMMRQESMKASLGYGSGAFDPALVDATVAFVRRVLDGG
jgi:dienelactone hydrolase